MKKWFAATLLFCSACTAAEVQSPNILFIIVDDLGRQDVAAYGSTFYETPNIDRLASQGIQVVDVKFNSVLTVTVTGIFLDQYCPAGAG